MNPSLCLQAVYILNVKKTNDMIDVADFIFLARKCFVGADKTDIWRDQLQQLLLIFKKPES